MTKIEIETLLDKIDEITNEIDYYNTEELEEENEMLGSCVSYLFSAYSKLEYYKNKNYE